MIKRLKELGFKNMEFNLNCNNLNLGAFTEVSLAIIMLNLIMLICEGYYSCKFVTPS